MNSFKELKKTETSQDLSAGSLTLNLAPTQRDVFVHLAAIHADGNISQTAVVKLISASGANYTFELDSTALSTADDYVYNPGKPIPVPAGWTFRLTLTNTSTPANTVYASIVYQER